MKVVAPLVKNILVSLGITANASAIDSGIQNKIYGSGVLSDPASPATTFINYKKEMNDRMKIVQNLKDSNNFLKRVTKTIKNEAQEQKGGFLICSEVL